MEDKKQYTRPELLIGKVLLDPNNPIPLQSGETHEYDDEWGDE